jgi:hypothetical protein
MYRGRIAAPATMRKLMKQASEHHDTMYRRFKYSWWTCIKTPQAEV